MKHTCHAFGCDTPVPPSKLMCADHWRQVAPELQRAVCDAYRPGQQRDKRPSREYVTAALAAVRSLSARKPAT